MKGISLETIGGPYTLSSTLLKPIPGPHQILVKSLVTAINPVEGFMQSTGLMVTSWPIVLGCDASGVVVETGSQVQKFKVGDRVLGCTALGIQGHSTFQEYFIMDAHLAFKKPAVVSTEEAATVGVGLLTAALALITGTELPLEPQPVKDNSPWIIVPGAAGSVGQFALQLARLCGYKTIAACSPSNNELVTRLGANATFSYKLTLEEQLAEIKRITGGDFTRVFDASAMATETAMAALSQVAKEGKKYFSTTNDWAPIEPKEGVATHQVTLGDIGREGSDRITKVNKDIAELIPKLEILLEKGQLKPLEYVRVGDVGVGEVLKALDAFNTHKSGKKIVVRLAED